MGYNTNPYLEMFWYDEKTGEYHPISSEIKEFKVKKESIFKRILHKIIRKKTPIF